MLQDVQAIADAVGALLVSECRDLPLNHQSGPLQPRAFCVEVRPDDTGAVDNDQHLRPAAMALANLIRHDRITTFAEMELPPPGTCESARYVGPIPVRVIRHLQIFPDPVYKLDADDNVMYDDEGEPIWDDEAMSLQKVPFWRVRIDLLGGAD